jgi:hypothetical protein
MGIVGSDAAIAASSHIRRNSQTSYTSGGSSSQNSSAMEDAVSFLKNLQQQHQEAHHQCPVSVNGESDEGRSLSQSFVSISSEMALCEEEEHSVHSHSLTHSKRVSGSSAYTAHAHAHTYTPCHPPPSSSSSRSGGLTVGKQCMSDQALHLLNSLESPSAGSNSNGVGNGLHSSPPTGENSVARSRLSDSRRSHNIRTSSRGGGKKSSTGTCNKKS